MLLITAASWPVLYATLELPKRIINEAIGGEKFPQVWLGFEFDQVEFLLLLCAAFMAFYLMYAGLKYYINVYRGRLGELMLRRLRFALYARILRFPISHFKRQSSGEIIPMITSEVEPVGGFIGDAIALPAFQGGMLMVYLGFIFVQDFWLGLAAVAFYPFQIWFIPRLQKKVNQLAKQRVRTIRTLADQVGETVSGITEIHANDLSRHARANVTHKLGTIYKIRYEIFRRKFAIKFINNFLAQLTPFFFYSIGGYFVIKGELSFGALVAVLAAYKDLASPWKELLSWYQQKEDVRIKYDQVIEQFHPENMLKEELQAGTADLPEPLAGTLEAVRLTYAEDGWVSGVEGASFSFPLGTRVAIVGGGGSGKEELTQLLARLLTPTGGNLTIGDLDLDALPESVTGRRIGYVGSNAFLFATSLKDNLLLSIRHTPVRERDLDPESLEILEQDRFDARRTGNSSDDFAADWTDYRSAGVRDDAELQDRIMELIKLVDLEDSVYQLGLRGVLDPKARPEFAKRILKAREAMKDRLSEESLAPLIEFFDEDAYNTNATLSENLVFGMPRHGAAGDALTVDELCRNEYVIETLRETGLYADLVEVGRQVAETMVELFSGLPPGHEFFEQYSFIGYDELPEYQAMLGRASMSGVDDLREEDRDRLIGLSFRLIPARHRLGLVTEDIRNRVLEARKYFAENLPEDMQGTIEFIDKDRYIAGATIQDNILFGKISYGQAGSAGKVARLISEVLHNLDVRDVVMEVGLDFNVGIGGTRLSAGQRQKVAIARAMLKRPDIIILNEATGAMDTATQARLMEAVLTEFEGRTVIWSLHRASLAEHFDHVLALKSGRVAAQGTFEELAAGTNPLSQMIAAE